MGGKSMSEGWSDPAFDYIYSLTGNELACDRNLLPLSTLSGTYIFSCLKGEVAGEAIGYDTCQLYALRCNDSDT